MVEVHNSVVVFLNLDVDKITTVFLSERFVCGCAAVLQKLLIPLTLLGWQLCTELLVLDTLPSTLCKTRFSANQVSLCLVAVVWYTVNKYG